MEKAVAADPDSALTHAGLAEAQWYTYFQTRDRVWLDRAFESARQAGLRHPDLGAGTSYHRLAEVQHRPLRAGRDRTEARH